MRIIMQTLLVCALAVTVQAQDATLADKLTEGGAEWLLGTWTGTDAEGSSVKLIYAQEFGGKAGSFELKSAEMNVKGLIAVDAYSGEIREFGVSDRGALLTGTWDDQGSGPTLDATWTLPDGSRMQRTYVHEWVDSKSMRVKVYQGSVWSSDPEYELLLKRAP